MKQYIILEKDRVRFTSLALLNEIIQFQHYFPIKLTGDDVFIERYLKEMLEKGLLAVKNGKYIPTDKGREEIVNLYAKYTDYLRMYDVYCAVDLTKGEFAFSSMANFSDEQEKEWIEFLGQERFSDVRVAVADFKNINPTEIIYMAFLQEGRFTCDTPNWQKLISGEEIWNQIEEICNTAISVEYLKSEGVIENIIKDGTKVALGLIKLAEEANAVQEPEQGIEEVIETTTTEEVEQYVDTVAMPTYPYSYWDSYYYDPFYVNPLWLVAAVVLW